MENISVNSAILTVVEFTNFLLYCRLRVSLYFN